MYFKVNWILNFPPFLQVSKVLHHHHHYQQQQQRPLLDMARNRSHRVSTCSSSTGSSGGDHLAAKLHVHKSSVYCPPQVGVVVSQSSLL